MVKSDKSYTHICKQNFVLPGDHKVRTAYLVLLKHFREDDGFDVWLKQLAQYENPLSPS